MWVFIFTALTASTYGTLKTATNDGVIEAYAKERQVRSTYSYAVFDKTMRERVHRRWFSYTKIVRKYEVCEVKKQYARDLVEDHKTSYIGKSRNGSMFYKVKMRYQSEVRSEMNDRKCTVVDRPWWNIFVFNGGGAVS